MNKKLISILSVAIMAGFLMAPQTSFANCGDCGGGDAKGWSGKSCSSGGEKCHKGGLESKFCKKTRMILDNQDELELTESQIDKIKALKANVKKAVIRTSADIDIAKVDIHHQLRQNPVDVGAVNALLDTKYAAKLTKAKTLAKGIADLKAVLKADQYAKLKDLYKNQNWGGGKVCSKS